MFAPFKVQSSSRSIAVFASHGFHGQHSHSGLGLCTPRFHLKGGLDQSFCEGGYVK